MTHSIKLPQSREGAEAGSRVERRGKVGARARPSQESLGAEVELMSVRGSRGRGESREGAEGGSRAERGLRGGSGG
eukprot:444129-Rhodomonas_salina.1